MQQGGLPSPLDRYNGARWAAKAVEYFERQGAPGLCTSARAPRARRSHAQHWRAGRRRAVPPARPPVSDALSRPKFGVRQGGRASAEALRVYTTDPDTGVVIGYRRTRAGRGNGRSGVCAGREACRSWDAPSSR